MVTQPSSDTDFAVTVAQIMRTQLSTYAQVQERLLSKISIIPLSYGKTSIYRPVADPDQIVVLDRTFAGSPTDQADKIVQHLNLVCLSDRLSIPRVDFAGDAANAALHVSAHSQLLLDAIEATLIEGAAAKVLTYGIADYPSGTAGTVNRPEMAYNDTTAGAWSTTANIRNDMIDSLGGLIVKKFYGRPLLLTPTLVRPMMADVLANTSVSTSSWIKNNFGVDVAYSPFVHQGAAATDFNSYLIDTSKVHLGMSQIYMDSYYDDARHSYNFDWEVYISPLFDPLHDGTEYLKGVARLDAHSWA
jgi:hypothetical protein